MKTIFVSISSYEDPTLERTVRQAYEMARHPERIFFGINLQYKNIEEPDVLKYSKNISIIRYDVEERPGLARSRYEISKLYKNQDYFFQTDSHMLFAKDWDVLLIQDYEKMVEINGYKTMFTQALAPILNAPIGSEVSNYWTLKSPGQRMPDSELDDDESWPFILYRETGGPLKKYKIDEPYESTFATGHFLFFDGRFISEVGMNEISDIYMEDPYLIFKAYMSGWKVFSISKKDFYVAHDVESYNKSLYGVADFYSTGKYKKFGRAYDPRKNVIAIDLAVLYNIGPAMIKNPAISLEDLHKFFGTYEKLKEIRKEYDVRLSDYTEIANDR